MKVIIKVDEERAMFEISPENDSDFSLLSIVKRMDTRYPVAFWTKENGILAIGVTVNLVKQGEVG